MQDMKVYGFGSAFFNPAVGSDVDLLIIHPDTDIQSCKMAILCKRLLTDQVRYTHVTMLSVLEEIQFDFISRSAAILVGSVRPNHLDEDFQALLAGIQRLCPTLAIVTFVVLDEQKYL